MGRPSARPARRILALIVLLAACGIPVAAARLVPLVSRPRAQATVPPGAPFPPATLGDPRRADTVWSITRERGRAFLLLYIADACGHCGAEVARWDSLHRRWPSARRPRIIVIRAPDTGHRSPPVPFAARDLRDVDGMVGRALRLRGVPASYAIDARGIVVGGTVGQSSARRLATTFSSIDPEDP